MQYVSSTSQLACRLIHARSIA